MLAFQFPPLGPTGEEAGEVIHRGEHGHLLWDNRDGFYVTKQTDRPTVAYRCHYPGGSAPCDHDIAVEFAAWVGTTPYDERSI